MNILMIIHRVAKSYFLHNTSTPIAQFAFRWWRNDRLLMTSPMHYTTIATRTLVNRYLIDYISISFKAIFTAGRVRNHITQQWRHNWRDSVSNHQPHSIVYPDADKRKHQSYALLASLQGIHRSPVNSPHKWPVTRKMFPFDGVIMLTVRYTGNDFSRCTVSAKHTFVDNIVQVQNLEYLNIFANINILRAICATSLECQTHKRLLVSIDEATIHTRILLYSQVKMFDSNLKKYI